MSRIVDIEPVITKLENTQKQNVHTFSKRELVDAIADIMNLKPIDAAPVKHGYWIPTSERMPKREKMVLVCFRWSGPEQFDIGYTDKDPDNLQLRWNFEDFELYGDEMDDVVAWMPLPEPYKMDEVKE